MPCVGLRVRGCWSGVRVDVWICVGEWVCVGLLVCVGVWVRGMCRTVVFKLMSMLRTLNRHDLPQLFRKESIKIGQIDMIWYLNRWLS